LLNAKLSGHLKEVSQKIGDLFLLKTVRRMEPLIFKEAFSFKIPFYL